MKNLFFRLYLLLIMTFIGLGWSIDKLYSSVTAERQITSDIGLHKGTFFLLNAELKRHSDAKQTQHLAALSTSFGYPVVLVNQNQLVESLQQTEQPLQGLNKEQLDYLAAGGIATLYYDTQGESWFYKKLTGTDKIMVFGPILTEPIIQSDIIYTIVFFIGLAFIVFIWVWPISDGLMTLTKATTAFGQGDFSVRANDKVSSPLVLLVKRFNSMAERIQRLIKSHKELSHAVSHELRTPIARIRFAMEIIREEEDKALIEQYLDTMDENIEELDGLVDELLVYAKFDREEPQLTLSQVNLKVLAQDILKRFSLTETELTFTLHCAPHTQEHMLNCQIDKESMTRMIDNLVRNAVRYAKSTIEIHLSTNETTMLVTVEDDGPGIPEHQWDVLFDPFVRLDQSRDRKSGGIGLGLAIVKRFIALHKGQAKIARSSLGGASFELKWPRYLTRSN